MSPAMVKSLLAEAREVATLVAYLAGPLSSATNGSAIRAESDILPGIL